MMLKRLNKNVFPGFVRNGRFGIFLCPFFKGEKNMSCRYKDICPSYSGWCEGPKQDFSKCVSFLITAYEITKEELQKYKDTGLTPEQLVEMDREYCLLSREVTSLKERLEALRSCQK
jgi:hypothetical protein